jgi:hypothetical protein
VRTRFEVGSQHIKGGVGQGRYSCQSGRHMQGDVHNEGKVAPPVLVPTAAQRAVPKHRRQQAAPPQPISPAQHLVWVIGAVPHKHQVYSTGRHVLGGLATVAGRRPCIARGRSQQSLLRAVGRGGVGCCDVQPLQLGPQVVPAVRGLLATASRMSYLFCTLVLSRAGTFHSNQVAQLHMIV